MANNAGSPLKPSSSQSFVNQLTFAAIVTSIIIICLGCAVIVGWLFNLAVLKSLVPGQVTMKISTAISFILAGIVLLVWYQQQNHQPQFSSRQALVWQYFLSTCVIIFTWLTLCEYSFNLNLGTDWLSFPEVTETGATITSGKMAPNTAFNFFLFNLAFLFLIQKYYLAAQLLIILVVAIAITSLIGHIYSITLFYGLGSETGMAIHTAMGFILLAFAFLGTCSERGWMRVITREQAGGVMARWLLPILVIIPLLSGWLFWWLLDGNSDYIELIVSLRILLEMVLFSAIVWWAAKKLNEIDCQRQQFSQALLDSERRFRAIFQQNFQFIGLLATDGTVLEANQSFLDFGGIELSEVSGKPIWETYWWQIADSTQLIQQAIARAREGEFIRYEVELQGAKERVLTIDFSLRPIFDGKTVTLLILEGRDISESKQAKAALQTSEARYRAIVEDQTELICRYLPDSTILFVNQAYCNYFGVVKALVNQKYTPVIYEADLERVTQLVNLMNRDNPTITIENRVWAKGEVRWTQWNNRMIFNREGELLEYQAVGRDITKLKKVEEELRESEQRFRQLAENIRDIFMLYSTTGELIYVSPAYEKIWHQSRSSLYENPESWLSIVHPSDRDLVAQAVAHRNHQDRTFEYRIIDLNGQIRWLRTRTFIIQDEFGKVYRVASIGEDITKQKQAEAKFNSLIEELERSNQSLEEFASVVSHDLLSPLHKQLMLKELLEDHSGEILDETAKDYLERMAQLNQKMQNLVRGLLSFARVTTQAQPFVPVDLHVLVREVVEEFQAEIAQVNGQIELGELSTINGDRLQLYQLFQNLLENAIKFRSTKPLKIKIYQLSVTQTQLQFQSHQIVVEDNGIGFKPEEAEKIFIPFHRLHGFSKYQGTGLGLAICRKIVERHQGTIVAQSQPQQGTTLTICFPQSICLGATTRQSR